METENCVLVTGAGSGIGRAIALRFTREGWSVLGVDLKEDGLDETQQLASDNSGRLAPLTLDITDTEAPEKALKAAISLFGRLDVLVNNAGIGRAKSVEFTTDEEWDKFIAVNQTSVFRMAREALKYLPEHTGNIVNIASIAGVIGLTNAIAYVASKTAVIGMTRQLAADFGPRGIRINAVAPGQIETPLTADRIANDPRFAAFNVDPIPFPRLGHPEDIANAVYFLASDQAAYINGHTLVVDGGWTAASFSRRGYAL